MSSATKTTDHDIIREWAEQRGGRPAVIRTGDGSGGVLRLDFGEKEDALEEIGWEEADIAFLHQEETDNGALSRFFKFIRQDEEG